MEGFNKGEEIMFFVELRGNVLGVEVPESTTVYAKNTEEAIKKAMERSILENPQLVKVEEINLKKSKY